MNNGLLPSGRPTNYTSDLQPVGANIVTVPHPLARTPQGVRWVLVCQVAELGYTAGDEVHLATMYGSSHDITVTANGASASILFYAPANIAILNKGNPGGGASNITAARWKLKCYLQ
jgi:hypothetical protein